MSAIEKGLGAFVKDSNFRGQGPLCVALVVTEHAKKLGLPLNADALITEGGGQVLGLGKGGVQAILKRHGIERVLAAEGGRTSRGSMGNMKAYVAFLNDNAKSAADLDEAEKFWVARVQEFFAGKPFKIRMDGARGLRVIVRDLVKQAEERRKASPGVQYTGALMQHLIGAKLDCALGVGKIKHNSFSTADAPTGRAGDFLIGEAAIHVTTTPGEALLGKCAENLNEGLRPIIVTLAKGVAVAEGLAENIGVSERVDIFEVEQFVATNLYELGSFATEGQKVATAALIDRYNALIEEFETDPSLAIEISTRTK